MKIREIAELLNKSEREVEGMLKLKNEIVIELREISQKKSEDNFNIDVI